MFDALAKMLGIRHDQAEDALKSERAAKATLDRRGFLRFGAVAGAALAAGSLFSFPGVEVAERIVAAPRSKLTLTTFDALLKELYMDSELVERLVYQPTPFLAANWRPHADQGEAPIRVL